MKMRNLIARCKAATGMTRGYRWEVGTDYGKDNPNHPFKTQDRMWDGGLADLSSMTKHAKPGRMMDCYVSTTGEDGELYTNVDIHIVNETTARVKDISDKEWTTVTI